MYHYRYTLDTHVIRRLNRLTIAWPQIGALYCLGLPQSMAILRSLQEHHFETGYTYIIIYIYIYVCTCTV